MANIILKIRFNSIHIFTIFSWTKENWKYIWKTIKTKIFFHNLNIIEFKHIITIKIKNLRENSQKYLKYKVVILINSKNKSYNRSPSRIFTEYYSLFSNSIIAWYSLCKLYPYHHSNELYRIAMMMHNRVSRSGLKFFKD